MQSEQKLLKRAFILTASIWVIVFCSALPIFRGDRDSERHQSPPGSIDIHDETLFAAAR